MHLSLQIVRAVSTNLALRQNALSLYRDVMVWVISVLKSSSSCPGFSFKHVFLSSNYYIALILHNAYCINVSVVISPLFLFFSSLSLTDFSLLLHLLIPPPLPLSPFSLPFPFTSLPLFSLTLKSTQSLRSSSFPASTCWQEEKEEDAALYPRCVLATPPASARCL